VQLVGGTINLMNNNLMNNTELLFLNKCRLPVLLASLTQQCILAYFPAGNSLLNIPINGSNRITMVDGSFGWRWLATLSAV